MDEKIKISGYEITEEDIEVAEYVVETYGRFSRKELARTLCFCQDWVTRRDMPKIELGIKVLEYLESIGRIILPPKDEKKAEAGRVAMKAIPITNKTDPGKELTGEVSDYPGIRLQPTFKPPGQALWKEYIERYHPEKYAKPYGTNIRYLIKYKTKVLGCMLFSASAWALEDRDKWIGWTERDRSQRLIYLVNNSRFLILPWIKIHNLASYVLGLAARQIQYDWLKNYFYAPVLMETFIDPAHYKGTCYKAANWQKVGITKGRGRQDRYGEYLSTPREIYMYPLEKDFKRYLLGEKGPIMRERGVF